MRGHIKVAVTFDTPSCFDYLLGSKQLGESFSCLASIYYHLSDWFVTEILE